MHTFYECEEIKIFWQIFKTWVNHITNINLEFKKEDIIFGIHRTIPFNTVINFCVLIGKFFIHICSKERKRPSLMDYIVTLKHYLIIEKQVYDRKGKSGISTGEVYFLFYLSVFKVIVFFCKCYAIQCIYSMFIC